MKRILFALVLVLLVSISAMAQDKCYTSDLRTADEVISYNGGCLCGVLLYPAAADSTLVVYDNALGNTTGKVLFKTSAAANAIPSGFPPTSCINVNSGISVDVGGAAAGYIIWYR
jgi:hypothetical protein